MKSISSGLLLTPHLSILLPLSLAMLGCDSRQQDVASAEDRAWDTLREKVTAAMCEPWGAKREAILAELVEASGDEDLGSVPTYEDISDMAGEVEEKDCLEAGYPRLGPKPLDIELELRRCRRGDLSIVPGSTAEQRARAEERNARRREFCAELQSELGAQ